MQSDWGDGLLCLPRCRIQKQARPRRSSHPQMYKVHTSSTPVINELESAGSSDPIGVHVERSISWRVCVSWSQVVLWFVKIVLGR